jgi:hypothetical protein
MREARDRAHEEGVALAFPLKPTDVAAIHTSFLKHGHGIYFRLKDGRVFSAFGTELDPNPACYDDTTPAIRPASPSRAGTPPGQTS